MKNNKYIFHLVIMISLQKIIFDSYIINKFFKNTGVLIIFQRQVFHKSFLKSMRKLFKGILYYSFFVF